MVEVSQNNKISQNKPGPAATCGLRYWMSHCRVPPSPWECCKCCDLVRVMGGRGSRREGVVRDLDNPWGEDSLREGKVRQR